MCKTTTKTIIKEYQEILKTSSVNRTYSMFTDLKILYCKSVNSPETHLQIQHNLNCSSGRFFCVEIDNLIINIYEYVKI